MKEITFFFLMVIKRLRTFKLAKWFHTADSTRRLTLRQYSKQNDILIIISGKSEKIPKLA